MADIHRFPERAHGGDAHEASGCEVDLRPAVSAQRSGLAPFDKFDGAGIPVPPHRMAAPGRFEAVEGQIKFESGGVKRGGMKPGSLIVQIHHHAGMHAADAVKMQHRGLIDFNALKGPTLDHDNILKKLI